MNRAKKRKIEKLARDADMQNYPVALEDALASCHNKKARAQLRSRILRGK